VVKDVRDDRHQELADLVRSVLASGTTVGARLLAPVGVLDPG